MDGVMVLAEGDSDAVVQHVLEQARASDDFARTASTEEAMWLARSRGREELPAVVVVGPTIRHPLRAARQLKAAGLDAYFVFAAAHSEAPQLRQQLFYAAPPDSQWALEVADSPRLGHVIQKGIAAVAQRKRLRMTLDRINSSRSETALLDSARYRQLIVSDRYLASILEHAADGIISLDVGGIVTSWNRGAERLFGVPSSAAIGASAASLLPTLDGISESIENAVSGDVSRRELQLETNGTIRYLDAMATPIETELGEVIGLALILRDITERKHAEKAVTEADLRKDQFLSVLAHELRNPIASIQNAAHLLNAPELEEHQRAQTRAVIDRQVRHMARLLDDLLDVSRISRGRLTLRKEPVRLAAAIDAAVEIARPAIDAKRHTLEVDIPDAPIILDVDPDRLTQILGNVLMNAARYTETSGRIRIGVTTEGGLVAISVEDNGMGIAQDRLAGVFEMFARPLIEHAASGLGVGLALARGLAELHGGTMEAHSEGEGRGSRFVVSLPCRIEAGA